MENNTSNAEADKKHCNFNKSVKILEMEPESTSPRKQMKMSFGTKTNRKNKKSSKLDKKINEDFSPRAKSRMTKIGKNNKISKEKGWGEFEVVFGNRIADKGGLKFERKLEYSYFVIALKTKDVKILEQQMEYLQLRPKKYSDTRSKNKGENTKSENIDGNEYVIECPECGYKSTRNITMIEHMMGHTEEYLLCEECDAKFSDITELRKHMMSHTSCLPYACTECDFICAQREEIKAHIIYHKNIISNS